MPPLSPFSRTCVAVAIGQALVMPAQAAIIEVDDPADSEASNGICSLREAVATAQGSTTDCGAGNAS